MVSKNAAKLAGQRFGYLTALRRAGRHAKSRNALWLCRCDCGEEVVVRSDRLRLGLRKACAINGHRWLDWIEERGLVRTGRFRNERTSFEKMWERCRNKKHTKYKAYGAAGITVCERWRSFKNFIEDMGPKPSPKHSIDRIDNKKGYEPGNCRWATAKEQMRNQRRNIYVTYNGDRVLLIELTEKLGLNRSIVYGRLKLGWKLEDALTIPVRPKKCKKKP